MIRSCYFLLRLGRDVHGRYISSAFAAVILPCSNCASYSGRSALRFSGHEWRAYHQTIRISFASSA